MLKVWTDLPKAHTTQVWALAYIQRIPATITELWSHPMTAHICISSPSSQRPPLLDTSHHTESDHAQLHFHQQYKPDRSNLTSASYSTGYLSICFWFIFLQSKEEIMIDNQQLGSTADLLGKIEDSLKNIASHLLFPNKALEASSESQMHHAFVRMGEGSPIADSSPQMMFTSKRWGHRPNSPLLNE